MTASRETGGEGREHWFACRTRLPEGHLDKGDGSCDCDARALATPRPVEVTEDVEEAVARARWEWEDRAVRNAPELVRRLGARLADLLDADHWNGVEPMLVQVATALRAQPAGLDALADEPPEFPPPMKPAPSRRDELFARIGAELDRAYAKHGRDPWGRHEFYAILLEEVEEMWSDIKTDAPDDSFFKELVQVAAMCFRYYETGDRYRAAAAAPVADAGGTPDA